MGRFQYSGLHGRWAVSYTHLDVYKRQSISIEEALALDFANHMDGRNLSMMYENIEAAIASGAESTCELCLSGPVSYTHLDVYKRQT